MGLLSKLGVGPADAVKVVTDAAGDVADIVERWKPSEKAKHDMGLESQAADAKTTQEARNYDPKTTLEGSSLLALIVNSINVVVDAMNRLVRPTLAFTLMGSLFSWWEVKLNTTDPLMVEMSVAVFGFYFGVRGITEDLPKIIRVFAELRKKNAAG